MNAAATQTPDRRRATNFHSNPADSFTVLTIVVYVPALLADPCRRRQHLSMHPHVISRTFACFHVVQSRVSAGQRDFCSGFDSRRLHQESAGHSVEFPENRLYVNGGR